MTVGDGIGLGAALLFAPIWVPFAFIAIIAVGAIVTLAGLVVLIALGEVWDSIKRACKRSNP